jgi:hypothetical protein
MTTENNKLIAEFMNFRPTNNCIRSESGKYYDYFATDKFSCIKEQEIQIESENGFGLVEQDFLFIEDLKFHSDWNWLMEVVEKIESSGIDVHINTCVCRIVDVGEDRFEDIECFVNDNKKQAVYNACIEFIKWYNQQQKYFW